VHPAELYVFDVYCEAARHIYVLVTRFRLHPPAILRQI